MKSVLTLLNKVFVVEFYRANASLFLVVLGLGAGFMRAEDHIALGVLFTSSPLLVMIPISIWIVYSIIVIKFNADLIVRDENEFIYNLSLITDRNRITAIFLTTLLQNSPIAFYGIFLIALALKSGGLIVILQIVMTLGLLGIASVIHLNAKVKQNSFSKDGWAITKFINLKFTKPFPLFFPEWIARRDITVLLGTKVFSLLALYAVAQLYKFDPYDSRLMSLAVLVAFLSQANLIWSLHFFDNQVMSIYRNLPLSFTRRAGSFIITVALLLLPETGMLIGNFPVQLSTITLITLIFFGWSCCLLMYGFLYWKPMAVDQLTGRIFYLFIALTVVILFNPSMILLGAINGITGLLLWSRFYYAFEPVIRESLDELSV